MPTWWRTRAWTSPPHSFLTDIYGSEDLSRLDANVRRVVPAMKRVLPAAGLEIVAQAIELEALSEDLDFAMARVLGAEANELSWAAYGAAYRKVDRRADRERQDQTHQEGSRQVT